MFASRGIPRRGMEPESRAPDLPRNLERLRFSCFTFLLAAAILIHQLHENHFADGSLLDAALEIAAMWALVGPGSLVRLLVLCAAQLAVFCEQMPFVWSHWVFLALCNLTILATAARFAIAARRAVRRDELFNAVAPALRLALLLLYGFAALAKLNADYLAPERSCAVMLYEQLLHSCPWMPTGALADEASIWSSLSIELALPFLLFFRRTRVAALFLGGAFHVILGITQRYDFSAAMLPFYSLFVPERAWNGLEALGRRYARSALTRIAAVRVPTPMMWGALVGSVLVARFGSAIFGGRARLDDESLAMGELLWLALCAASGVLLIASLREGRSGDAPAASLRVRSPIALLGPLLIILNGLSPYLGLNTERDFTMFSNLRTEADRWNHLLLPRGMRVFGFQDELDTIVISTDTDLHELAQRHESLVHFELQRRLSAAPDATVVFATGGRIHQLYHAKEDPELTTPPSPALAKLLWFRPVPHDGRCLH
jgi:hypothetical protein